MLVFPSAAPGDISPERKRNVRKLTDFSLLPFDSNIKTADLRLFLLIF